MDASTIFQYVVTYKYLALFVIAFFEGPLVCLFAGFMVFSGYLSIIPTYITMVLGDFTPDVIYYYFGVFGDKKKLIEKYGKKFIFISTKIELLKKMWDEHGRKTMFFSKLAYGLSTPFIISAGLVKMSLKRFVSLCLPITLFQHIIILAIGYHLGYSYAIAEKYIKLGYVAVAVTLIIVIIFYVIFAKYAKKEIEEIEREEKIIT
ncbi:MAG: hypothetical protein WCC74_03340 [Minisyncoccia bacterium]